VTRSQLRSFIAVPEMAAEINALESARKRKITGTQLKPHSIKTGRLSLGTTHGSTGHRTRQLMAFCTQKLRRVDTGIVTSASMFQRRWRISSGIAQQHMITI
jgi:hypothetical protein